MAKKKTPMKPKNMPKGMHQMPDGHMMSDAEMEKMMGGKPMGKTAYEMAEKTKMKAKTKAKPKKKVY